MFQQAWFFYHVLMFSILLHSHNRNPHCCSHLFLCTGCCNIASPAQIWCASTYDDSSSALSFMWCCPPLSDLLLLYICILKGDMAVLWQCSRGSSRGKVVLMLTYSLKFKLLWPQEQPLLLPVVDWVFSCPLSCLSSQAKDTFHSCWQSNSHLKKKLHGMLCHHLVICQL